MGIVIKPYILTHHNGLNIDASMITKPLNVIYDEFNGSINSENFSSNFTIAATQVFVNATAGNLTATNVESLLVDLPIKGFNSVWVQHGGKVSGTGLKLLDGLIEINSKMVVVTALNISGVVCLTATTGYNTGVYAILAQGPASDNVFRASDVGMVLIDNISPTGGYNSDKMGFYFSQSHRVVCTIRCFTSGTDALSAKFIDGEYLQTPQFYRNEILLDRSAAEGYGFSAAITSNFFSVCSVYQYFDYNFNRFGYKIYGRLSETGTFVAFNACTTSSYLIQHGASLQLASAAGSLYEIDNGVFRGSGTTATLFYIYGDFVVDASTSDGGNVTVTTLTTALTNMIFTYNIVPTAKGTSLI